MTENNPFSVEYKDTYERYEPWVPVLELTMQKLHHKDKASHSIYQRCIDCIKKMDTRAKNATYFSALEGELKGLMYSLKVIEDSKNE